MPSTSTASGQLHVRILRSAESVGEARRAGGVLRRLLPALLHENCRHAVWPPRQHRAGGRLTHALCPGPPLRDARGALADLFHLADRHQSLPPCATVSYSPASALLADAAVLLRHCVAPENIARLPPPAGRYRVSRTLVTHCPQVFDGRPPDSQRPHS